MEEIIDRIVQIEKETSQEKGEYIFFGVLLREDSPNRWDIVVAASWLTPGIIDGYAYLGKKLNSYLNEREIILISRVVILDPTHQNLKFKKVIDVEHGLVEIAHTQFLGIDIKYAYLITSKNSIAA